MIRRLVFIFVVFILFINCANAYELVLPKEKRSVNNSQYALFVGKARLNETIYINSQKVYIAPNGAFAYTHKLKNGENRVVLRSDYKRELFKFYKEKKSNNEKQNIIDLEPQVFVVTNDEAPMRSTPVDFGLNRIAHLFKGTKLIINGESGDFYRVFLSKDKIGWIFKSSVEKCVNGIDVKPEFVNMETQELRNASIQTIEFSELLPYTVVETNNEIVFKVYNPFVSEESVYTINLKKPKKYYYRITHNCGKYQIKLNEIISNDEQILEGVIIAVDAGHGGTELGAIGCLGDREKDVNLAVAQKLKSILESKGATVVMIRDCDGEVPLQTRIDIARENCANIFISIHHNSIGDVPMDVKKTRGTSVYYYNKNSESLAKIIHKQIINNAGTKNDKVHSASFAVIRPTDYIGVLVEVAYMINPLDSMLYTKESFQQKVAEGIADGLVDYLAK